MTNVILVDKNNQKIGEIEKLIAHQRGLLHRAFSVFVYRKNLTLNIREFLLQKRHTDKYHSPGLWTNTCCSHPLPHENIMTAAMRRLKEEMGLESHDLFNLTEIGVFHYTASVGNNLIENEIDHVLTAQLKISEKMITPDSTEVSDFCWIELENLKNKMKQNPENYTAWLFKALSFIQPDF